MRRLAILSGAAAIFASIALFTSIQMANQACFLGFEQARASQFLPFNLIFYLLWGMLLALVFPFCRLLQRRVGRWPAFLPLHLAAGLLFAYAHLAMAYGVIKLGLHMETALLGTAYGLGNFFSKWIYTNLYTYAALAGGTHFLLVYRQNREQELRASQLEAELARARLQTLRMQIQPHFLFNTLNSISATVYKDRNQAVRMIARLSELLRLSLESGAGADVPLEAEIAMSRKYLDLESVRFGDRLRVEYDLPGDLLEWRVPALILQPLVENAIRHGIAPRIDGGAIRISAQRQNEHLALQVEDDGAGLNPPSAIGGEGIGLANIRQRLLRMYGDAASLEIAPGPAGGCRAVILLPPRPESGS